MLGALALALASACGSDPAGAPTFAADIAPILYASCAPCHRPGEPAPFPLLGYDDARRKHAQIARVVQRRAMPPWLPDEGDFVDDRRLDASAIDAIARWSAVGAPRGNAADEPPVPSFPTGWQLRAPDLVVVAPEAVDVPAEGPNALRNLVIPIELDGLRHVEAVEIRPGNPAVHHAILAVDATREARRLDVLDPGPGFAGMSVGNASAPDGHFLGWTPGKQTRVEAPGMAWRLRPGHDLVLQLHLTPTGKPETVRPQIGFYFTDVPTAVVPEMLVLFSEAIDIAPGVADFRLTDHLTLPVPVELHAIYPHAHYLCRTMRAEAALPDGSTRTLFHIGAWDFDWQGDYRYRRPIALPAGTRLSIDYRYDNTEGNASNPHRPPRRVTFGQESTDEMGTLTLTVTVAGEDDRRRLAEAVVRRDLEKRPWDPVLWVRLAEALRRLGRIDDAERAARAALELRPDHAPAHCELGVCLEARGQLGEAERSYLESIRLDPDQSTARLQLGGILGRSGRTAGAIEQFERALAVFPNLPELHNNLATACFAAGRLDRAEAHYRRALGLDEGYFNARFNLGRVLVAAGRVDDARRELERANALQPGHPGVAEALRGLRR